ncbi:MAG: hypothetical protein FWC36_08975 [Spirochaetes bacterium]|nr:hypothetical protein [Spirochaetota bacterium]
MDKSITDVKESIASLLQIARDNLKTGDFEKAKVEIEKAFSIDYNEQFVINGLKFANFWIERKMRFQTVEGHYERGSYLFRQWKAFIAFLEKFDKADDELTIYAIKYWVFNQALHHYNQLYENGADDLEILTKIGLCYKNLGDYCRALEFLETVMQSKTEDAELIAEVADCYAFIDEVKASKIFFREAFFIDPQSIDIYSLESLLIKKLIGRVKSLGFNDKLLKEWIPVYGVLYGVFNVKRELKVLELGKLKQSISALEHQFDEDLQNRETTIPRLLNRYFWLIDYYISTNDSKDRIEDVLRKINKINPSVYELYSN